MEIERRDGWDEYVRDLGHELAKRRRALGLSQEAVASAAGLARSQYQRLERGLVSRTQSANPTLATLLAVAQVLETTVA
ncbi:MAG: helix-turn-helix domain-containing protein, partial [Micrococcales bacterium]|nr:helix-turn-helix domain-containing protein [Micrococcales bacterium]